MGTSRQVTLMESWGGGRGARAPVPPVPVFPRPEPSTSFGRRTKFTKPRGGGRGRGRGAGKRGSSRGGNSGGQRGPAAAEGAFEEDEDDGICEAALSNFELTTNDISKAFEEVNASKDIPGFDVSAGDIWIYPTNRPVRDYQFNIVQTALYHNTLVSLPTGLGKTFIAAVVMYNFHRWYPNNIIVFMAPTRPLVTQQLDACHDLMGIPPSKMIELTGQTIPKKREDLWKEKKVFFLTPQVMTSDLGRGFCPADQVRCVVVDEAHKSLGNHAFAQVIKMLAEKNKCFRVLGLSATPGNDITAVQQVLQNLLISRVELRSEKSSDILPYTHQKQVETVIVPLDVLIKSVHDKVMEIFQMYTGKLMKINVLHGKDGSSFTPFQLLREREAFRENPPPKLANFQRGYIEADFATCITLSHSTELLLMHGLRSFYSFLHGVVCKQKSTPAVAAELKKNTNIEEILAEVQTKLNISAENSIFDLSTSGLFTTFSKPDTSDLAEPANPDDYLLSHPKMRVLKDIVAKHFQSFQEKSQSTRVMIFSQYRDSVQEIGNMLNSLRPLVKPMVFIGQAKSSGNTSGRGLKQKEQIQVVQGFKSGGFNVLVSTCVGEEGLDIGEVDLIICFDASKSPTRLVQRMGRTGRQRQGRTIFLLAEGKEQRMYSSSVSQYSNISRTLTDTRQLNPFLYKQSPRMVPVGINPQCYKMEIILSSEQRTTVTGSVNQLGRTIIVDDDDSLESVPQHAAASKPSKKKLVKKASGSVTSSNPGSIASVNTITKCFLNAKLKAAAVSPKPGSTGQNGNLVGDPIQQLPRIDEDDTSSDCLILDDHNLSFHAARPAMLGEDYANYVRKMLGVKKVDGNTVARCVFVPKVSTPITWRPEFNDLDPKRVMLQDFEVQCLREKLNTVYMVGPSSSRCECGLVNEDPMFDFEDDVDFEVDIPAYNSETNSYLNSVEKRLPLESNPWSNTIPKVTAQETRRFEENKDSLSKINESVFVNDQDAGFILDENDPFFQDDWTGDMEEDFANVQPVSTSTPRVDNFKFHNREINTLERASGVNPKEESVQLIPLDIDSDSTTLSDDAFGPVLHRRNTSVQNPVKPVTPKPQAQMVVCDTKMDTAASSSDECFPPSPEVPKRVVKKKFVFQKKSPMGPIVPLQELVPAPISVPQHIRSPLVSPMPKTPSFTEQIKLSATNIRPPAKSRNLPSVGSLQMSRYNNPSSSRGHVPVHRGVLPFKNTFANVAEDTDDNSPNSSDIFVVPKSSRLQPMEDDFANVQPVSTSTPRVNNFKFQKREINIVERASGVNAKEEPVELIPLDIDSDSTLSDDAFGPVLHRRHTSVQNPVKPVTPKPPVVDAQSVVCDVKMDATASSSDECFPPSPEVPKRVVKKKFVFQKKSPMGPSIPLQELVPAPISVPQRITSQLVSPMPKPASFTEWIKPSATHIQPPAKSRNLPTVGSLQMTGYNNLNSSRGHVPVHRGVFPFKNKFADVAEDADDSSSDSSDIFVVPKSSRRQPSATPPRQTHKRKRRKPTSKNPFVIDEVEVSGDEEDSMDEDWDSDLDGLDASFVSNDKSPRQSESQQVRYMRSVRDVYLNPRKPGKKALDELVMEGLNANNYTESQYEEDSFVVRNDDVEFEEIGTFTQAMQIAQVAVDQESPSSRSKKNLRSNRRTRQTERSPIIPKPKRRRRIIVPSDDDDD